HRPAAGARHSSQGGTLNRAQRKRSTFTARAWSSTGGGQLRAANQVGAVRVLFDFRGKLLQRAAVVLLGEAAQGLAVRAAFDDRRAHVRTRRGYERQQRQQHDRQHQTAREAPCQRQPILDRSALRDRKSHELGIQRYQRPRANPTVRRALAKPSAHASWLNARTSAAPAPPMRARSCGSPASRRSACASARGSPAGTTRPLTSSRTSPPAAAPTASLAITGNRRFIASL